MKTIDTNCMEELQRSECAKARMQLSEPLFVADWDSVLMIHFTVDANQLQREVPFELDLRDEQAFVTLVAFTMRDIRPVFGGRWTSWLLRPLAIQDFLNVRTYVRVGGEVGIHFLAERVSSRLAVVLGPRTFSLPYRLGRINYRNDWRAGELSGRVEDAETGAEFAYRAEFENGARYSECERGSLDEWLMERSAAFNAARGRLRSFRVCHEPWPQCPARVEMADISLLDDNWIWFADAEYVGANYSPGVFDGLGWPHRIK